MSIPTIRAALDWLLAVCDTDESNVLDIDPDRLVDAIAFARAALAAERAGEGPSDADLHRMAFSYSQPCFEFDYIGFARSILTRWGCPAAPPVPDAGEVGELIQCCRIRAASLGAEGANLSQRGDAAYFTRAADQLEQFSAPAPAVVTVAVEALTRLYWWGGMREGGGYDSNVVLGVHHWIAGGMAGALPQLPKWIADRCPPLPQCGEVEA